MRLLRVVDTTSGSDSTIKVAKVVYSDESVDIVVHQIEGTFTDVEDFEHAWDRQAPGVVNFLSLGILDARRLVNALIEEIQGEQHTT